MQELLERSFAGQSVRDIAEEVGVSHETIAQRIRAEKREHVLHISGELLLARRTHEVLWLAIPSTDGKDIALRLRYVAWLIEELDHLLLPVRIHVAEKDDGICIGLEEVVSRPAAGGHGAPEELEAQR